MASEENRSLKNIEGKKLRRIYFDVPLIFLYSVMLAVPYAILVISWGIGKFDFAEWLSAFRTSVLVCVGFSLPFIILRALNKRFFGRIVCVLAKEGINYPKGKIRYETTEKIEYAMDSRTKFKSDIAKPFRLIIYTNGGKHIVLSGVPFCAVSKIKACVKGNDIKITGVKSLLSVISAVAAIILAVPFYVVLLCNAPGISVARFAVFAAIWVVLDIILMPIFDKYAVGYRFWHKILPKKWLSYIILGIYYLSFFAVMLILFYFPNWFVICTLGIYMGVVQPPVPTRNGGARQNNILSYEKLYDIYINKADFWEKKTGKK